MASVPNYGAILNAHKDRIKLGLAGSKGPRQSRSAVKPATARQRRSAERTAAIASIFHLKRRISQMPISVQHAVAAAAAPMLTGLMQQSWDGGRTVYGDARPKGKQGGDLDLVETGATRRHAHFAAEGRKVSCKLRTPYAKYLVGKYRVLPAGDIPAEWSRRLRRLVADVELLA